MAAQGRRGSAALRWLAAGTCGAAVALAFPPFQLLVLLPLGVAGLTWSCTGSRLRAAAGAGGGFGVVFCLVLMPWLRVIGVDAWIAVALLEAAFYALLGLGLCLVTRLRWWPLWVAGLWVATELARSQVPFGGFPWGRLAFATVDSPLAAYARFGGAAAVTALVALASNLVLWALLTLIHHRPDPATGRTPAWRAGLVALLVAGGILAAGSLVPLASPRSGQAVVALVQGNVAHGGLRAFAQARAVLDNHANATHQLASRVHAGAVPAPDLAIWPESSTDVDPFTDRAAAVTISAAARDLGAPILVGATTFDAKTAKRRNIGVVWDPVTGPGDVYRKRHAVPFGEYIPLRGVFAPLVHRLDQIPYDLATGRKPGVLSLAGVPIGDVICFEVAYDGLVRDVVSGGARLVVVQTNNATYLGTSQLEQQWEISRLRAIETGRTVAVAATDGISGFAAADGDVLQRSAPGTRALLVRRVALYDAVSPGVRFGSALEVVLAALGVAAAVVGAVATHPRRSTRRLP